MNEEVRVSRQLVETFWKDRMTESGLNANAAVKYHQVTHAKDKELVTDFKAIRHILGRAIKELEGKR